jgi:hypothetical protein
VSAVLAVWRAAVVLAIKEYKNEKLQIYSIQYLWYNSSFYVGVKLGLSQREEHM